MQEDNRTLHVTALDRQHALRADLRDSAENQLVYVLEIIADLIKNESLIKSKSIHSWWREFR